MHRLRGNSVKPSTIMNDLIFIALAVGFFVLSAAYVRFCEKVR